MLWQYIVCRKGESPSAVLSRPTNHYWSSCGPSGNERMEACWLAGGPLGTRMFLTVSPCVAFKLELRGIYPNGFLFVRTCRQASQDPEAEEQLWLARPKGQQKLLNSSLTNMGDQVRIEHRTLGGDLILEEMYLDGRL